MSMLFSDATSGERIQNGSQELVAALELPFFAEGSGPSFRRRPRDAEAAHGDNGSARRG